MENFIDDDGEPVYPVLPPPAKAHWLAFVALAVFAFGFVGMLVWVLA